MVDERPYVLYRKFSRLNEVASPEALEDHELQEAINVVYDEAGGLSKRPGLERYNAEPYDANPIERLINFSRKNILLAASGNTLRKLDGTVVKDQLVNVDFDWEVFSDGKLYLLNGDNYYVYDGTTFAEVTNSEPDSNLAAIKKCKYIVQRGARMFAAGNPDSPNSIYFSEVNDPTYFKNTSEITAVSDDNDIITGLAEFHGAMVTFKHKHVYAWFGHDPEVDVQFDKINVHMGAVSNRTIKRAYNFLLYMGIDGVYALTGLEPKYISSVSLTDDVLRNRFGHLKITDDVKSKACAEFYDGKYLLSIKEEGTVNDTVLVYDFRTPAERAWSVWKGWNASAFMVAEIGGREVLCVGSANTGLVYLHPPVGNAYLDDGEPILFRITTKKLDCNYPLHFKKLTWFYLMLGEGTENNAAEVSVVCDNKTVRLSNGIQLNTFLVPGASMLDEDVPEGRTRLYFKRARMLARSLRTQVTVENNEINEPITVYGVGFQFWPIV